MGSRGKLSLFKQLRAPVDGAVQQLACLLEGAVSKPADPILVIVPKDAPLVVEAQVLNREVGFLREGQEASVKLEAFNFTRYGTLPGRLVWISRDAVQDEKLGPVYQVRGGGSTAARSMPTASACRCRRGWWRRSR